MPPLVPLFLAVDRGQTIYLFTSTNRTTTVKSGEMMSEAWACSSTQAYLQWVREQEVDNNYV